ncbi:MAG: efflux RND transporter periplasmic adaptor subunit [Candidatus Paceibacterota bacterium]
MQIKIFSKIKNFIFSHKILSAVILIAVIGSAAAVYFLLPKKESLTYVTQAVKKGDISVTISGTGQVSSLKEVNISSKVSGDVIGVYVESGDDVTEGDVLFKIDSTDELKNVKSAELALESAQLDLEEMTSPVDELTLLQAQNSLIEAQESKETAESNLEKSYDDGFNNVSNAFLELPSIMTGFSNVLFSTTITDSQQNIDYYASAIDYVSEYQGTKYRNEAYAKYEAAKAAYDKAFADYKAASRFSDKTTIESLIIETHDTVKTISDAIKSATNLIELYRYTMNDKQKTYDSTADTHITTLSGYTSNTNSQISTLLSSTTSIENYKKTIESSERSIKVKQLSLEDVEEGYTDLEIRTQELTVEKAEQALANEKVTYNNYWVKASFSGTISGVDTIVGDSVNSGTVMGSLITKKMIAEITLNEVDIASVEIGQRVDITFDALDDLSIEGEVAEVDAVGTVSQGVVSYTVKISFDTDNTSVKPGMSITANIIVDSVADVLTVPATAVKTMQKSSYVQVMNAEGVIERKTVETGLTDDTTIEIKSGLSEGDKVITSTSSSTKTTTTTKTNTTNSDTQQGPGGGMDMMMITR